MSEIKKAEEPKVGDALYHIRIEKGQIPRFVFLPGDPDRVKVFAKSWDSSQMVAQEREYLTYKGVYKGVELACTSTGIGSGAIAIAVEELLRVGADTLIRTGTTGALWKDIGIGDLIISLGAYRADGATKAYAPIAYPAIANYEVVSALVEAAETVGVRYWLGITYSTDSFYLGQGRSGFGGFTNEFSEKIVETLKKLNIINMEMESSTLFTLASIYKVRAGSIFAAIANRETGEFVPNAGVETMVKVSNEAVKILKEWDEKKKINGKRYFYPSLIKK
ncbi:MAG: uridine phosphorylase [Nitrososphaeria archaeon]